MNESLHYLNKLLKFFILSGMSESTSDEINLPEISGPSLATLIKYIYNGKYVHKLYFTLRMDVVSLCILC